MADPRCVCGEELDDVAEGALPLAMSGWQPRQQQLVGTDVNVADVTLSSTMKPTLQRFCDATSNVAEKARALELLTALELSSAIKAEAADGRPSAITPMSSGVGGDAGDDLQGGWRRPRTAAPRLQGGAAAAACRREPSDCDTSGIVYTGGGGFSRVNSYETTHNYYYQPPVPSPSKAVRPASSQIQRVVPPPRELPPGNAFSDLFMSTTYGREFFAKSKEAGGRTAPERAGSARGVRNNNPHPNREFLVWRYRRPMTATEKIESSVTAASVQSAQDDQPQHQTQMLTNESFDRAVRGKCRSTYQHDFLGVPTTFDVDRREVSLLAVEGRQLAPAFDRSSTSRDAFVPPPPGGLPAELAVAKVRFGQHRSSRPGVIPAGGLSSGTLGMRTRTTYDAHVNEPANRLMRVADLRQLSNAQNAQAVARMLDGASGGERQALMKLYREMQCRQIPASIPMPVERRLFKERVGGHLQAGLGHPAWLSTWTGPA